MVDFEYSSWFDPTIGWFKSGKSSLVGKRNVFSPICFFSADDCWRPMQLGVHLGWVLPGLRFVRLRLWFASDGRLASRFSWGTSSCRWWCLGWIEAGRGWCACGELSRKHLKSGLVFFFLGGGKGWHLNQVGLEKQRRCSRHLFDFFSIHNFDWLYHWNYWRLTWHIIMEVWKIMFLSKWAICRFHVNLPGCTYPGPRNLLRFFEVCWIWLRQGLVGFTISSFTSEGSSQDLHASLRDHWCVG